MEGRRLIQNTKKFGQATQPEKSGAEAFFDKKDDRFIWNAFKANNESAFVYIYSRYFPELVNYGHQFTREQQLVEDCIQDIFIDLRKNRKNLTGNLQSIKLYLYKALKRRIIEYRRKPTLSAMENVQDHIDFEIVPSVEFVIVGEQQQQERLQQMNRALDQLTDRQREVLFYLYYENLSYQEIKDLMGMDHVRSVRNLVYKAVSIMKSLVRFLIVFPFWI